MKQSKNEINLGEGSVGRLLLTLAVPSVIAQLVNLLYNLVDRIYIGHIPENRGRGTDRSWTLLPDSDDCHGIFRSDRVWRGAACCYFHGKRQK